MISEKSLKRKAGVLTAVLLFAGLMFFCFAEISHGWSEDDIRYTEGITGGAIYFDKETGTITGCEVTVTEAVIPEEIEGVKVVKLNAGFPKRLVSLHIPATVTNITSKEMYFDNHPSLETIIVDEGNPRYTSVNGVLFEKTAEGLKLRRYPSARKGVKYILPDNVISVETGAFFNCGYLETIDLNGVKILKRNSINSRSALTEIRISKETESIEAFAIEGCEKLKNIYVDNNNAEYLSENGIIYNKDRSRLVYYPAGKEEEIFEVPDGVNSIAGGAFHSCKLKNIVLPDSLTEPESHAFTSAANLETIKLPDGVVKIPDGLFSACYNLKSVVLSEKTEKIGSYAFSHCYELNAIKLPDNISSIGAGAFECCYKLEDVNIPQNLRDITLVLFHHCRSLRSVVLPKQIKIILSNAFYGCNELEKVYIQNDDIVIKDETFLGCSHLTIYANEDSAAHRFADANGISFRLLDGSIPQQITCSNNIAKTYGDEPFTIGADARTSLSYESSAPEIIEVSQDGIATVKGAGKAVITITAAKENEYDSAEKQVTVTVGKAEQTIEAAEGYSKVYKAAPFRIKASAKTSLSYESNAPEIIEVSRDGIATIKGAGRAVIKVTAAENDNYNGAVREIPVYVAKVEQTISGKSKFTKIFGCGSFSLSASAKTKLTYRSSNKNILTVSSAGRVYLKNPGKAYVYITAAKTSNYKQAVRKVTISSSLKKPVLYAKNVRTRKTKLTWTKVPGAMRYQVYICYPGKKTFVNRLEKSYIIKSVTHSGLKKGKIYKYKVRAYRIVNGKRVYGSFSSVRSVKIYR